MSVKNNIPLVGGLITALLSTVCCIVPLLLLTLGIGGSWIANLTALEPFKPYFIGFAISLLAIAYWQIFLKILLLRKIGPFLGLYQFHPHHL